MTTNSNRALDNMYYAIENIGKMQKAENASLILARVFFDAKYQEICELFLKYPDKNAFVKFMEYDQTHRQKYDEAMRR